MKNCNEIHPNTIVNTGFTCCANDFKVFKDLELSGDALMEIVDQANRGKSFPLGEVYNLYGVKRNTQFEGYGRATECDEQPWRFFISAKFSGEDSDIIGADRRTFKEALVELAFHLDRMKTAVLKPTTEGGV